MGGYTFFQDARLQCLPRLRYNNVPADTGGRYYCIKEPDRPAWNPDFSHTRTPLDHYCCRHGLGYTVIESQKDDLKSELTAFIPLGETCEIHRLKLSNASEETRQITLHRMAEWCLWDAELVPERHRPWTIAYSSQPGPFRPFLDSSMSFAPSTVAGIRYDRGRLERMTTAVSLAGSKPR